MFLAICDTKYDYLDLSCVVAYFPNQHLQVISSCLVQNLRVQYFVTLDLMDSIAHTFEFIVNKFIVIK